MSNEDQNARVSELDTASCSALRAAMKWKSITPERRVEKTPQNGEYTIPARYHGEGYSTVDPDTPLWREVRAAMRQEYGPKIYKQTKTWCVDYCVIECKQLAERVVAIFSKHPKTIRHFLREASGLSLPNDKGQTPRD